MAIFVDKNTRVVVQGITGKEGQFHAARCPISGFVSTPRSSSSPTENATTGTSFAFRPALPSSL